MKKYLYLFSLICCFTACEDYLNLNPEDSLSPDNYYNTAAEVEKAVNGIYHGLVMQGGIDFILNSEVMTDNCIYSSASGSEWLAFTKGNLNASNLFVEKRWKNNYKAIARANLVIANLNHKESMVISEAKRQQYMGEAQFLRAYFYADLLNYFGGIYYADSLSYPDANGGVPVVMDVLDNITAYNLSRTPAPLVFDTIMCDLDCAIKFLLPQPPANGVGRATKGAAMFLKARMLLFTKHYAEADSILTELKMLDEYQLLPEFADVFAPDNENNEEVIFDIQYSDATNYDSSYPFYTPIKLYAGGYVPTVSLAQEFYTLRGLPATFPPRRFGDLFKDRDKRLEATLTCPYDNWGEKAYIPVASDKKNYQSCMKVCKYLVFSDLTNSNKRSTLNVILFRYADALLMQAECIIEDEQLYLHRRTEAIALLDQIRTRAGLPTIDKVIANPTREELRELLRRERRCELAFENSRLNDIRRWGIAEEVMNPDAIGYDPEIFSDGNWDLYSIEGNRMFLPHHYSWPIPQSELDANININSNNPGY